VVHDSKGNARSNLRQEDFQLLDNGKPQVISHFAMETPNGGETDSALSHPKPSVQVEGELASDSSVPHRYVALFFDDIHLRISDLMQAKTAAMNYVSSANLSNDRIGVFTSSGLVTMEFTDDVAKIRQAVSQILPHPIASDPTSECPEIFDYQAYLIVEKHDQAAIDMATEEYYHCNCEQLEDSPRQAMQCRQQGAYSVESFAMRQMTLFQTNTMAALRSINQLILHLSGFPGQRTMILVSPGFLIRSFESQLDETMDRALHANITVNTLDAKGLYAPLPGGDDITKNPVITPRRPDLVGQKEQLRLDRIVAADDPLSDLAYATGGTFFHNNNDLDAGFKKCGAPPEVSYVLAYSPTNLKPDGSFHSIKVKLAQPKGLALQSRRGYFARKKSTDPTVQAKEEIQDAIFSPEDLNELPIDVHTQFFRVNETDSKLSVMIHVDLRFVHFQKREGRNFDNLTLVTVLFDQNGKYLTAQEKTLQMRLHDATLARLSPSGITMKASFQVKPGSYMVRQVVRDAEGSQISGISRSVQIPF
jgi:VWFA-related protein